MLIAALHIAGALGVSFGLGLLMLWVAHWEQKRNQARRLQDAALALGVPIASIETEGMAVRVVKYSSERYSSELLQNRLADFCGALRTAWGWFWLLAQVVIMGLVAWGMFVDGAEVAAGMWFVPAVAIFAWAISAAFSLLCLVLTGRYPGEPKASRKALAEYMARAPGLEG